MMSIEEGYLCTGKAFIYQWLGRMSTSGSECWVTDTGKNRKRWGYSHAIKTLLLRILLRNALHGCNYSPCCSGRRSGHARRISSSDKRKMIQSFSAMLSMAVIASLAIVGVDPVMLGVFLVAMGEIWLIDILSPWIHEISIIFRQKGHALMAKSLDSYILHTPILNLQPLFPPHYEYS